MIVSCSALFYDITKKFKLFIFIFFCFFLLNTEYIIIEKSEIGKEKKNRLFSTRDIDISHFMFPRFLSEHVFTLIFYFL